jgi:hypothetical protein
MEIILNVLLIVLTLSLTFIPMTGDLWLKQKSKTKTKTKIFWRGYLFMSLAFLAVVFGIIQVVRSAKDQIERDKAQTEILDNTKQITGGDSYCRMEIGIPVESRDVGYLGFFVEGKYPLSRVTVRINDLNDPDSEIKSVSDIFKNAYSLGTLDPNVTTLTQKSIKLDENKGVNLVLFFSANNGFTIQTFRMRYVNGKWPSATRITSFEGDKELYLEIDPDYPVQDKEIIFR